MTTPREDAPCPNCEITHPWRDHAPREDVIAPPDRPPDRVTYGPPEPPEDNPNALRRRLVATDWTLFTVREYTEVVDDPRSWRRKRCEFWYTPEGTIGRWEWETIR